MDATPCEWVPNQIWHLHLAIDDATGFPVDAYFDTQETLNRYYHLLYQTLVDYGIPYEIFTDKRSMSHPWKRAFFERYIATRKHHNATEVASLMR